MNYKELISYDDKVNLYSNSNIPAENKVQDTDMNNIKNVVNGVINGTNVMGNVVVDSIRSKNLSTKNNGFTAVSNVIADFKVEKLSAGVTYTVSYYTDKSSQITNWYFKDADKNNVTNIERTNTTTRSSFQITPTTDIYYIGAWANDTTVKIFDFQIEEGSTATTYVPYQNLNGSYLAWQNSNAGTEFIAQDVNISNLNTYSYYEIIYKQHATAQNYMQSSGKIPIGQNCCLGGGILRTGAAPRFWARFVTYGTNKLSFSAGYYETTSDNSALTANDIIIPYQILLYK